MLTVGVPHLLLATAHDREVLDNGDRQVLELFQLDLDRLQLSRLSDLKPREN